MDNVISTEEWSYLVSKKMKDNTVGKIEAERILAVEGFSKL